MKAVILAGGSGSRLWPVSRKKSPKQFHRLSDHVTMLQETCNRLSFLKDEDIYIATNQDFAELVQEQLPSIPQENIILEPALRDTATCIGYAATVLSAKTPNEVMAIIYADHLIKDAKQFEQRLKVAAKIADEQKTLNIVEVEARFPNVNLGYVHVGEEIEKIDDVPVLEFKNFTEKPDAQKAKQFVDSGEYLWNTGIYVWRIDTLLEKYKIHLPDTYEKLMRMKASFGTEQEKEIVNEEYSSCEKTSIDYAIMEKVDPKEVKIIPADFGWSDVGTWENLHEELRISPEENVVHGSHMGIDTKGSYLRSHNEKKLIVTIGLEDMVVVDTPDALLVCPKNRSQDVKKVVEKLKELKRDDLL